MRKFSLVTLTAMLALAGMVMTSNALPTGTYVDATLANTTNAAVGGGQWQTPGSSSTDVEETSARGELRGDGVDGRADRTGGSSHRARHLGLRLVHGAHHLVGGHQVEIAVRRVDHLSGEAVKRIRLKGRRVHVELHFVGDHYGRKTSYSGSSRDVTYILKTVSA